MAGIGVLALIGAVAVALALGGGERAPTGTPAPTTTPTPVEAPATPVEAPATDEVAPPPEVVSTIVRMRSEPPGATVQVGEQTYGPTPTDVEWVGGDAERGRRVTLVFSLEGYQDYPVTRVVTGPNLEVEATLAPARATSRPSGRRSGRGGSGEVRGYKLDPY